MGFKGFPDPVHVQLAMEVWVAVGIWAKKQDLTFIQLFFSSIAQKMDAQLTDH